MKQKCFAKCGFHTPDAESVTEAEEIWDDEDLVSLLRVGQTLVDYVGMDEDTATEHSDWEQGVVASAKENTPPESGSDDETAPETISKTTA